MTKLLILPNHTCKLQDEPDHAFLSRLDVELSFKIQNAEHSQAYKMGRWDGIKRLLKSNLTFPYGLMERVKEFYQINNKDLEIIDQRPLKSLSTPIDILPNLQKLNKNPFPYQLETLEKIKNRDCNIIRMSVGAGKSLVISLMTAYFNKKTIVIVITTDLLYQMHSFFTSVFQQPIGIVGNGECEIHEFNIVSIWTIASALNLKNVVDDGDQDEIPLDQQKYIEVLQLLKECKLVITDECQICSVDTFTELSKYINPEYIFGLSGSPWRDDGSDLLLEAHLGKRCVNISSSELIRQGYLVRPTIQFIKVPKPKEKLPNHYQSICNQYIIENSERNQIIVDEVLKLVEEGRPTLLLYSNIKHGKILLNLLKDKTSCVLLSGKDEAQIRMQTKQDFQDGKIKLILASKIFDCGVDIPCISGLVLAHAGKSSVRNIQRCGRAIRNFPNKADAKIIDFIDNVKYLRNHSKIRMEIYRSEPEFIIKNE